MDATEIKNPFGAHGDERDRYGFHKWAFFRRDVVDYQSELLYDSRGPWPTPAPGRPLSEYAEIATLPKEELKDWNKNLLWFYVRTVVTRFIPGLIWAYFKSGKRYHHFDDNTFQDHITTGMYSKFLTALDPGDCDLFREKVPTVNDNSAHYMKMDFSCIDWICTRAYPDTYIAASIVLFTCEPGEAGTIFRPVAIHLYQTDAEHQKIVSEADTLVPADGQRWNLAKYFALQGAVHRVNMTEHGRLHFPFDSVNAVTKSILPTHHPLFRLLIPHLRLSLPVDNAVLEGKYSLLSRVNWVIYSPFAAEGKYTRKLIPDGYVGRSDKLHAFPPYFFNPLPHYPPTSFGIYLQKNFDVIHHFVKGVIELTLPAVYSSDDVSGTRRNWELIALWAECIAEWVPNFPLREDFLPEPDAQLNVHPNRDLLVEVIAYTLWNVSIAHAADHIGFGGAGPSRNVFRLHVKPPLKGVEVAAGFEARLVKPWDLFQSYLAHQLFYQQHNTVSLVDVQYDFSDFSERKKLDTLKENFIAALKQLDESETERDATLPRLKDVACSIQY